MLENCNLMTTPLQVNEKLCKDDGHNKANEKFYRSMIGSLLYLTSTRPHIMFASSYLSRLIQNPSQHHIGIAKRLLRYMKELLILEFILRPLLV